MKFFWINLVPYYFNFYIHAAKILGLYKIDNLYLNYAFKINNMAIELPYLNLLNFSLSLQKIILKQTLTNLTQSSDSYKLHIYPYLSLIHYKKLQLNFYKNKIFYNLILNYKLNKNKYVFFEQDNYLIFNNIENFTTKMLKIVKFKKMQKFRVGFFFNKVKKKILKKLKEFCFFKFILFKLVKLHFFKQLKKSEKFKRFKKIKNKYSLLSFYFKIFKIKKKLELYKLNILN